MNVFKEISAIQVPVNYTSQLTRKNEVLQLLRYRAMGVQDQLYAIEQAEILFTYAFIDDVEKQSELLDQYAAVLNKGDVSLAQQVRSKSNSSVKELLKTYLPQRNARIAALDPTQAQAQNAQAPVAGRMNGRSWQSKGLINAANRQATNNYIGGSMMSRQDQNNDELSTIMQSLKDTQAVKVASAKVKSKTWTMQQAQAYIMKNLSKDDKQKLKKAQRPMKWHSSATQDSETMDRADYAGEKIKSGEWTSEQARQYVSSQQVVDNEPPSHEQLNKVTDVLEESQASTAGVLDTIKSVVNMTPEERTKSLNDAMKKLNISSSQVAMASELVKKQLKARGLPSSVDEATKFASKNIPFPYSLAANQKNIDRIQQAYKTLAGEQGHNNAIRQVGGMFMGVDMNDQQTKWFQQLTEKVNTKLSGKKAKRFNELSAFIADKLKDHKLNELSVSERFAVLMAKGSLIDTLDPKLIGEDDYAMFLDILT